MWLMDVIIVIIIPKACVKDKQLTMLETYLSWEQELVYEAYVLRGLRK